jgi:HlyD family secretion protein
MRRTFSLSTRAAIRAAGAVALLAACGGEPEPDAYGTFEATEVVVSAQTTGQLLSFTPVEGMTLELGQDVALIDTAQLALERDQLVAQRAATGARTTEVGEQLRVLEVQREVSQRHYERIRRLHAQQAATASQLDQAERDFRSLGAQIDALRAQRRSVGLDAASADARVAQVLDRVGKSRVTNPEAGTVLATYVSAGEVVQAGRPLYRIAGLDTLEFRAYVTAPQLTAVRLGQAVEVRVDGPGGLLARPGTVSWISASAEFTPTPIQTRDDRGDLVYAVKVRVPNPDGALKIGMPGDVSFPASRTAP